MSLPTILDLTPPSSPLLATLLPYLRKHTSLSTTNHSIRPVYFMLLLAKKHPLFSKLTPTELETGMLALLMHDFGWATTKELLSKDKRFEVDGADLAVKFVQDHIKEVHEGSWDRHRIEDLWTSIALHATLSIASHHINPLMAVVHFSIGFDFFGPYAPPFQPQDVLTEEEYKAIVKEFPKENFKQNVVDVMCGLVRDKPATTMDNFVSSFGVRYGTDGKGAGKEEYEKQLREFSFADLLMASLDRTAALEKEVGGE